MRPPDVLRRWRVAVAELSPQVAATLLGFSRPHLVNMESGKRQLPRAEWKKIDKKYGAEGVLAQLLAASMTSALPPRHRWPHSYDHEPRPVWMWLRAATPNIPARVSWGTLHLSISAVPYPHGVIVTAPTSLPNPPAEVHFEPSAGLGWVGFGSGRVPAGFGVPLLDGAAAMSTPPWDRPSETWRLRSVLSRYWQQIMDLAGFFQIREKDVVPHLASVIPGDDPVSVDGSALELAVAPDSPEVRLIDYVELGDLRRAAGWKHTELAAEISKLPGIGDPVSADDIDGAESGRRSRRHRFLLAKIDLVLGLEGHSVLSPVTVPRTSGEVSVGFPSFWVGPVYVQFVAPPTALHKQERAVLTWGPWRRRMNVASGAVVTTRRSVVGAPPLLVEVPSGWRIAAGMGWPPGAHDVGEGWRPAGLSAMAQLAREWIAAVKAHRKREESRALEGQ